MIQFTVLGVPAPGGSKTVGFTQAGRHFVRDSAGHRGAAWKRAVVQAARLEMRHRAPLEGPLVLNVEFWMPRPKAHFGKNGLRPTAPLVPVVKPDATKLLRPLEDACSGTCWVDDAQIVEQHIYKVYGDPRAVVTISPWEPE